MNAVHQSCETEIGYTVTLPLFFLRNKCMSNLQHKYALKYKRKLLYNCMGMNVISSVLNPDTVP